VRLWRTLLQKAAEILGKRLSEAAPNESLEWMMGASALNKGDHMPVFYLINTTYALVSINGVVLPEVVAQKYALAVVVSRLGRPTDPLLSAHYDLSAHGFEVKDFEALNQVATAIIDEIVAIALEVRGEPILN